MSEIEKYALKAANLKCFREAQGFEEFKPFNVIIGRNNVGKSTLLDLVEFAVSRPNSNTLPGYMGNLPENLSTNRLI
jgi:chromosome segregation ATPase